MIKFVTINANGEKIAREFKTVEDIRKDWFDEKNGTTLPDGCDMLVSASVDGVSLDVPAVFLTLLVQLGVESEDRFKVSGNVKANASDDTLESFDLVDLVADEISEEDNEIREQRINKAIKYLKNNETFLQTLDRYVAEALSMTKDS